MKSQTITRSPLTRGRPVSDVERMDRLYLWRASKPGQRVHIQNPETGWAHCQAENCSSGKPFDGRGAEVPPARRLCGNCIDLAGRNEADYREPRLAVLMGERITEMKSDLFVSTGAPKPWKRVEQTRPAALLKSPPKMVRVPSKPKRGNVKYPKPFDDPLPW